MTEEIGIRLIPDLANRLTRTEPSTENTDYGVQNSDDISVLKKPAPPLKPITIDLSDLLNKVSELNLSTQQFSRELRFSIDNTSGRLMVKVIDSQSGDTIRQIPPEFTLHLARQFVEGNLEGGLLEVYV